MIYIKKSSAYAAALMLVSNAAAFAGKSNDTQMQDIQNRLNVLEQKQGATSNVINPSGRFDASNGTHFFVFGEALLLKATESNLAYGSPGSSSGPTSVSTSYNWENTNGRIRNQNMDWNWGLRAGIGYNLAHDSWDLSVNWMRFFNNHTNSMTADSANNSYLNATRLAPSLVQNFPSSPRNVTFNSITADWSLHLNQIDLDMGRMFYVSKFLRLRPHTGLRTQWINQEFQVNYNNSPSTNRSFVQEQENNFWGLGLNGGLDTLWGLGGGWSIYANGGLSLAFGRFNIQEDTVETTSAATEDRNKIFAKQKVKTAKLSTDLNLGLRWDKNFSDDKFHLGFNAGWEQHFYFGQNQLLNFQDDVNPGAFINRSGDLTLQGFSLGMRMDF